MRTRVRGSVVLERLEPGEYLVRHRKPGRGHAFPAVGMLKAEDLPKAPTRVRTVTLQTATWVFTHLKGHSWKVTGLDNAKRRILRQELGVKVVA